MLKAERHNYILEYMEKNGRVIVEDIAKELDISPMTIRRDLKYLEENKFIERSYGGAVLKGKLTTEVPYKQKATEHIEEKIRIAEYASSLVEDGHTIILDSGTTNMEIAKRITDRKELKVITPDLMIALYLSNYSNIELYCIGGRVHSNTKSCLGDLTNGFMDNIYVDILFIGTSSIDIDKGMTSPSEDKARLKRKMINSADTVILATDNHKFGKKSFIKICGIEELDILITDSAMNEDTVEKISKTELELVRV